jgi:hypothetical protein
MSNLNTGLAGFGKRDDWTVEIDELIDVNLYGIAIHNNRFTFQVSGFPLNRIVEFQQFLRTRPKDQTFSLHKGPTGRVDCAEHDDRLFLRLINNGECGANLAEFAIEAPECDLLAAAVEEAIKDAESRG